MFRFPWLSAAVIALACLGLAAATDTAPAPATQPTAAGEWKKVLADDCWYKWNKQPEQVFRGTLQRDDAPEPFMLMHSYRYKLGESHLELSLAFPGVRHVELEKLLGQSVEIQGKAEDAEWGERPGRHIWPAAIRVLIPVPTTQPATRPTANAAEADLDGRMDFRRAVNTWLGEEKALAQQLETESFEQSLKMMADWDSTYFKLIVDVNLYPPLPRTAALIVYSRRFAKLLDDTDGAKWARCRKSVLQQIDADLPQWSKLYRGGQRVYESAVLSSPGKDPSEFMVPLTFRLNAMVLLLAQKPDAECLPAVVRYADTLGEDTNWAIAALAADRIMIDVPAGSMNDQQRQIIGQYRTWRDKPEAAKFAAQKTIELPSFRAIRPHERAASMGVRSEPQANEERVKIVVPQDYQVLVLQDKSKGPYYDVSRTNTAMAMQIVGFARQLVEAGLKTPAQLRGTPVPATSPATQPAVR